MEGQPKSLLNSIWQGKPECWRKPEYNGSSQETYDHLDGSGDDVCGCRSTGESDGGNKVIRKIIHVSHSKYSSCNKERFTRGESDNVTKQPTGGKVAAFSP